MTLKLAWTSPEGKKIKERRTFRGSSEFSFYFLFMVVAGYKDEEVTIIKTIRRKIKLD